MEWIKNGKVICPNCGSLEVYLSELMLVVRDLEPWENTICYGDHDLHDLPSDKAEYNIRCFDCDYEMSDEDMKRYQV